MEFIYLYTWPSTLSQKLIKDNNNAMRLATKDNWSRQNRFKFLAKLFPINQLSYNRSI